MFRSKPQADASGPRRAGALLVHAATMMARTARLAVGLPDYARYVEHMRRQHPDRAPMDREAFFQERMQARYGRGRSRCC